MIKQLHKLLLLAAAFLFVANSYGQEVEIEIDGICYKFDRRGSTASVSDYKEGESDIIIPASITYNNKEYLVISIGSSSFYGCSGLTSITIPSSVTSIGMSAFYSCSGLTSINVSDSNPKYSSVDGMLCNKDQTKLIAVPNGKTSSIILPSSLTSIGSSAFEGCSGLTSITLPSSVRSIEFNAFRGCSGLTSITLPSSLTSIGNSAFRDCSGLTSITLPSSLKSIGSYAFDDCKLFPLYILGKQLKLDAYTFKGLNSLSVIIAYNTEFEAIRRSWKHSLRNIEAPYFISVNEANLCSLSFRIVPDEYAYITATLRSVKFGDIEITPDENGLYTVTGLEPGTSYELVVTYETAEGEERSQTETVRTKELVIDASNSATQTTATLRITASEDESCSLTKKGIIFDGKTYECKDDKVVLTDLVPGRKYYATLFADYGSKRVTKDGFSFTTKSLQPAIVQQDLGPTSVTLRGSHTAGDAHVSEAGFTGYDGGNTLILTELKPETEYTVTYYVRTKEGSNESASQTFATPALELITLQPRSVSNSCAIVAATTNIGEDETSVGFQWKKYDAPASLAPSEGYAAIYGGQLEGYIRNLQSTSYYNVRAFYKSAEGDYYYGGWVTFDPSDFSYFEPTVHTYAAAEVTHSSAWMKGYILAGTDAIEKQGFEYWPLNSGAAKAMSVNDAAVAGNVQTVLATGQVMRAELRDLLPATTYCCRAFVKTATGTTYGEELTFTTLDAPTGVGVVETATPDAPTVIGYYDLSGRKSATPHRGVNIVRYSDGTARKMLVK